MKQLTLAVTLLVSTLCTAAASTPVPPRIDGHCNAAPYRQFDFWLGDWDVYDKAGTLQGHNLVTREYGNCVVREQWSSVDQLGSSFSAYDFRTQRSGTIAGLTPWATFCKWMEVLRTAAAAKQW